MSVQWVRGAQTEETALFPVEADTLATIDQKFDKVSSFKIDEKKNLYEKKMVRPNPSNLILLV